ncbi:transposase [Sphingomonas bacterium]|uniref:transposase n=1 Tax=Sphingomonas bacterium TaxID=1895847 RepID=UPI0015775B3C|nr:transposase [Sphingomonas bacterium]
MSQVTVISGVERHRLWSDEQKRALAAAACEPGAGVAQIARRAELRPSQLCRWRRDLVTPAATAVAAVTVSPEPLSAAEQPTIVVELGGAALRIAANASPALVSAVMRSLRR